MLEAVAVAAIARDTEFLRVTYPVLADYIRNAVEGADLDRLRRAARLSGDPRMEAFVDALLAARSALVELEHPMSQPAAVTPDGGGERG